MSRVRPLLTAAVLTVALAGGVATAAGATARPGRGAATTSTVVFTCSATYVSRPGTYTTTCADGYTYFSSLHWSTWSRTSATATGTFHLNPCTPNCVSSKEVAYPATVHLSALRSVAGREVYSELSATYLVGKSQHRYTFSLPTKRD